jgi:general stress protein 26
MSMNDDGANARARLSELMAKFNTAMLVTRTADGQLRARPLTFAGEHDGLLCFSTSAESPKAAELTDDPRVAVTMQDDSRYVSIAGTAELSDDPALIEKLWREPWRVWFPEGKSDPQLRILRVKPVLAEYWDQSGARGIKYLIEMVKAYATGTTPASGVSSDDVKVPL